MLRSSDTALIPSDQRYPVWVSYKPTRSGLNHDNKTFFFLKTVPAFVRVILLTNLLPPVSHFNSVNDTAGMCVTAPTCLHICM